MMEICAQDLQKKNIEFIISKAYVYEYGYETISTIVERWKNYGKSDFEIYFKYSKEWSLKRKIVSLFYPLNNELLKPLNKLNFFDKIKIFPFLLIITSVRYFFWIKYSNQR